VALLRSEAAGTRLVTDVIGYEYFGRPYVFGEAPGPSAGRPLSGARRRLGVLAGVGEDEMAQLFEWRNLLDEWPGYGPGGGSEFPSRAARQAAQELALSGAERRIYLGRRVAGAFGFHGEWLVWRGRESVCPHPSGLNRWWNDPENVGRAREFWRREVSWQISRCATS